jgi:signal transduction histidine kinase
MAGEGNKALLSCRLKYYSWLIILAWTGCVATSLLLNLLEHQENTLKIARNSAEITLENDLLYRKWAANQGGVYVPVSGHTPPNPYLKVPNRDVTTTSGLSLTLVNPAYMSRQVNQMAAGTRGSRGHLTSLNPIRPENRPDSWEAAALTSFEKGGREVSSLEKMDNEEYMRLMRPFVAEKPCLKCHEAQGYKEGDIRGGISVSIPMSPLRDIEKSHFAKMSLAHFFLWMLGVTGIAASKKSLAKQVLAREAAEKELRGRTAQLETSNRELEGFSYSVSHDLRAPLRAIDGFSTRLLRDFKDKFDADGVRKLNAIKSSAQKMGRLIDDLLAFSRLSRKEMKATEFSVELMMRDVWKEIVESNPDREVEFLIADTAPALGDPSLIRQVYVNLLSNAAKFTKDRKPAIIEAGSYGQGNDVVYYVKDNGVGFDMQYHHKLFGVFERLHSEEEYEGTGVGLAIVQRVINRHGGRIWAESAVNEGATFYFTLAGKEKPAP